MKKNTAAGMSDQMIGMLAQVDKQKGFPAGTMYSMMQQEVGGNSEKYLKDPAAYHYGLNAEGKRIAGHTGKVSTAFGPFGILESTGRDPGYGVVPLKDKSIEEQIRFSGDYLAARVKREGGLEAGLAAYGERGKYGKQVMSRIAGGNVPAQTQAQPQISNVAAAPMPAPDIVATAEPGMPVQRAAPVIAPEAVAEAPFFTPTPQPVPVQQALAEEKIPEWDALQMAMAPQDFMGNTKANLGRMSSWLKRA